MAYASLVSLEQTIDELLHHHDQYSISLREKQQIISTNEYITFLKAFLEDFPGKANSLEGRVRDVASEAEDIIEYYISKSTAGAGWAKFSQLSKRLRLHFNFKKLKKVVREATQIKNSTTTNDAQLSNGYSSVATSSSRLVTPTSKDTMVGFDDDLMAIKFRLCGESQNLEVIPIYGMGGIGKTTLARNAYDDPLTIEHFDIHAWVTVSQDYRAQDILSTLLVSMKAERFEENINKQIQELVYKSLKGRRYLIVMDDIWSTKAWDDVKKAFPEDYNGSRIILTTRLYDVAAYPDSSSSLHEMQFMDADKSWKLLQQKVFAGEKLCPPELETIGMAIARSCRGLPLAIVVIAGLLSTVGKTQKSWGNIAKNVNLAISNTNEELSTKIISLSYIHLPHYLRPCFLYMGGFEEDHEIRVSKLIKLWVTEGFLKPSESKSSEDVAEEYVEDLVKRSLVLVNRRKSNGKIKSLSVHDLVRDLCIRKAQEEKFLLNVTGMYAYKINHLIKSTRKPHRISVAFCHLIRLKNIYCSTIRTIICFHLDGSSLSSFGNFRLLRVLDVVSANCALWFIISKIPAEVFELIHLRYLAFPAAVKLIVPPSILNLQNLQTLIIDPGKTYWRAIPLLSVCLPMEIWRMPQLRHLIFIGPLPTIQQTAPTFPLENLQTLSGVNDFKCTEEILEMIPNLKKLGILCRTEEYVQDLDNLIHLHQLEKLKLEVYLGSFQEKLNPAFPTTLKKLTLVGLRLRWEDMLIVGSLPNLEVLKLRYYAFHGYKWETSEGEFPQLKFLLIDELAFHQWITESSHFPNLKYLVIYRCWNLSEIPDGIGEIPTLELTEVDDQNESVVESAKRIQEEQESEGNYALQVRVGDTWRK